MLLGTPNYIDEAIVTGSANWSAGAPVTNVATWELGDYARTTNTEDAYIYMDFQRAVSLCYGGLFNVNLSPTGSIYLDLGTASGGHQLFDGPGQPVWSLNYPNSQLTWRSGAWWPSSTNNRVRSPFFVPYAIQDWINARYATIRIHDPDNPDGYFQVGRAGMFGGFMPRLDQGFDLKDDWISQGSMQYVPGGAATPLRMPSRRGVQFTLNELGEENGEAWDVYEILRRCGNTEEVLYVPNVYDPRMTQRYGFLGTFESERRGLTWTGIGTRGVVLDLIERMP